MDIVPPSYQSATTRDAWIIIAQYIPSSDLCAASLVCQRWHKLFIPFLWGDPASHFGTDNDAVYVALTRFRRTLKYARRDVRMLTHTLHLPPALSEIYGGPRPEWLRDILEYLPCLQSLIVSKLSFFDHNAMMTLKKSGKNGLPMNSVNSHTYNIRLLLAENEPNTTSSGLAETLLCFQHLIYLDLSYTKSARDTSVLSALSQLEHLQVLKLRAIGLKDADAQFLANAIGVRVRFLDLRENVLTDMSVRSLLQACFLPPDSPEHNARRTGAPSLASLNFLQSSDLDEQYLKILTRPLASHSWIEDLPHVGITHLYIADNQLTVEGVASLLASSRLHSLDVGTVDTAEALSRRPRAISSPDDDGPRSFPGPEKFVPILGHSAKDRLTHLRAHHRVLTADVQFKDLVSPGVSLPELPDEGAQSIQEVQELSSDNEIHELPAEVNPIFELADTSIPERVQSVSLTDRTASEDEPLPRRGSAFAPEVVEQDQPAGYDTLQSEMLEPLPRAESPLSVSDPRAQRIQELLAKRPKNQAFPRRDSRESNFPFLHPSHVPHLETLVLTDVPSHVPADSPILESLIRFLTACSNEALLANLQAGTDYSLPPGHARLKAEQQRARSLFALRRLVLEITPTPKPIGPSKLTPWKPIGYENRTQKSSTGDRDSETMWSAAMNDFSFFGEAECGISDNDPGKYFPMAALNEKVSFMPEDDDSMHSADQDASMSFSPSRSRLEKGMSPSTSITSAPADIQESVPEVDVVAELAAFRRRKKSQYEELLRVSRARRSTNGTTSSFLAPSGSLSSLRSPSPSPSMSSTLAGVSAPLFSMTHFVEGHWKGEVKIVRNAAPKGRSGMVDMYGNYFEKGYLYP